MQNNIKRKGGNEFLGLKEKLVRTQDSLREIKRQVFLSGEGSVLLRFSNFMFSFGSEPTLQARIENGIHLCDRLGLHIPCSFS